MTQEHQKLCWLYKIHRPFSSMRKIFFGKCHLNAKKFNTYMVGEKFSKTPARYSILSRYQVNVSKLTIIASDYGLSPDRSQAISEPMLECCWLNPYEQNSVKTQSRFICFHSRKCIWKCCLWNYGHFVSPQCVNAVNPPDDINDDKSKLEHEMRLCLQSPRFMMPLVVNRPQRVNLQYFLSNRYLFSMVWCPCSITYLLVLEATQNW